ncbi:hypothetical protein [Streptomyces sp. NPDC055107]
MSSLISQLAFGASVVVEQGEGGVDGGAVAFQAGGEECRKGRAATCTEWSRLTCCAFTVMSRRRSFCGSRVLQK